jgi:hypothetical protein
MLYRGLSGAQTGARFDLQPAYLPAGAPRKFSKRPLCVSQFPDRLAGAAQIGKLRDTGPVCLEM